MRPAISFLCASVASWAVSCSEAVPSRGHPPFDRTGTRAYAVRPDAPNGMEIFRYRPGDVVETFDSPGGAFRVHYTRAGINGVPALDANASGIPDYVELVASTYDEVLTFYEGLGFKAPLSDVTEPDGNGGDARFDVYLLDFALQADGSFQVESCPEEAVQCWGFMVQENDFAGYGYPSARVAVRILASHEFFHAIQSAYAVNHGAVLGEATAVWATERFDPSLADFESLIRGYFEAPERTLNQEPTTPVDDFSYGVAIFIRFLEETQGEGIIRELFEQIDAQSEPDWLATVTTLLEARGTTFESAFLEFLEFNLSTGYAHSTGTTYENAPAYPRLQRTLVTASSAPMMSPRIFRTSARVFDAPLDGRTDFRVALTGDVEGLRVLTALTDSRDVLSVQGSTIASTGSATRVVMVIANTLVSGSSKRPTICFGSSVEVEACVHPPMPDAGVVDTGEVDAGIVAPEDATVTDASEDAGVSAPDAGTHDAGTTPEPTEEEGCGCESTASKGSGALVAWLFVALGLRRRRR